MLGDYCGITASAPSAGMVVQSANPRRLLCSVPTFNLSSTSGKWIEPAGSVRGKTLPRYRTLTIGLMLTFEETALLSDSYVSAHSLEAASWVCWMDMEMKLSEVNRARKLGEMAIRVLGVLHLTPNLHDVAR